MTPGPDDSPARPPGPTPVDVLRWCAAAAPDPWFAAPFADRAGVPRDGLHDPVWTLRQAGLIQVADWIKGRGQGFTVTPAGLKVLADPNPGIRPAADPPAEAPADDPVLPESALPDPRPTAVAPALLVACVAWFLVGVGVAAWAGRPVGPYLAGEETVTLMQIGAVNGVSVFRGEWWRVASSGFVHVGVGHLLMNMVSLGFVGPVVELLWGRRRFTAIYFLSGIAAGAAAAAVHPNVVTAGASGSIWGILLALLAWLLRYRDRLPPEVAQAWLRRVGLVLVVNTVVSLAPGVSWEGHFAGGAAGFAAAVLMDWTRAGESRRRTAAGLVGLAGVAALAVGGLVAATYATPAWRAIRTPPAAPDVSAAVERTQELRAAFEAVSPARLNQAQVAAVLAGKGDAPAGRKARDLRDKLRAGVAAAADTLPVAANSQRKRLQAYLIQAAAFVTALEEAQAEPAADRAAWGRVAEARIAANRAWVAANQP